MATVGHMGPFPGAVVLQPGQSAQIHFGESDGFRNCALSVTASAHTGTGGKVHVLQVDNVTITTTDVGDGDKFSAGCVVTNKGTTTITEWSVLVGVIVP